ncbi:E3 ubiquitin-protein ligase itt1 [Podospora aff. communis PSN243]|uniref:RBR-type E3 ubiquitin transferase n=1 Tax=Podospora aff. communis PSN243 TaxID=3040156 RepID=A0AAV9G7G6_9PEZI|nr:E3 ubiquitin-protein ligase itt1 [Podospora aff. communis PSN243]
MATSEYDMLVVIDQTASMSTYLRSLNQSLQDIIRISSLTGCFSRIGVMAYGDYCGGPITNWSGWYSLAGDSEIPQQQLLDFSCNLKADYGGDWPEATKSGLAHAYNVMRGDAKTLILLYTDAPPHMPYTGGDNYRTEKRNLTTSGNYGTSGPLFADWIAGSRAFATGEKRAQVFSFIQQPTSAYTSELTLLPYMFLSEVTGGACLQLKAGINSKEISELTVGMLLAWMGVEKEGAKLSSKEVAKMTQYKDKGSIDQVVSEESQSVARYITDPKLEPTQVANNLRYDNWKTNALSLENMATLIPQREIKIQDFAKRYYVDPAYQEQVIARMRELIQTDVAAITLNPVFGSLWRAICSDRTNPMRDTLIAEFGRQVNEAVGPQKDGLKVWLEESYDRAGEILQVISSVPSAEQYPCVFMDPTLDFNQEGYEPLRRDELLEIGRSCDARILRRLGRVLTRLTYVGCEADLPFHIKGVMLEDVARIPLALADKKYDRQFWKVLLHAVVPGTMLAGRPGALLAALSLRMGITPLEEVAYKELLAWKNQWKTLDIPETWNTSCLGLLLEADEKIRTKKSLGNKAREILHQSDRQLFKALVEYKMLEFNLRTTLTARIGWAPDRARMPIGPVVVCKQCQYPRSVTIMSKNGICGMCEPETYARHKDEEKDAVRQQLTHGHVSKDDSDTTPATWVECAMTHCRAQYIVYFVENLNVRPKCHCCRFTKDAAPFVECVTCLSRMVWPEEYRPADFDKSTFKCVGCTDGKATIIDEEISAEKLRKENENSDWLLRNTDSKIANPFSGRTLFHVISTAGFDDFSEKVEVLPQTTSAPELRIRGKLVRNSQELVEYLRRWVTSRKVEQGTCSLCFSDFKKRELRPACGRSGCKELICEACLGSWYNINARGRVINAAALCCPFCRRQPSPKVSIPSELKFLGGLKEAVRESQAGWIYAWCSSCGLAKRYMERVCAENAETAELTDWKCEDCPGDVGKQVSVTVKECPGCGTATEKSAGCDHMACPVEGCGAHWCFFCGKRVDEGLIYSHMSEEHGGWYAGGEWEEEYYSEGEDMD